MEIREHVPLTEHTTLRLGGPARFFVDVESVGELREALTYARDRSLAVFVLGGGSNTLFPDSGFNGLVIHVRLLGTEYTEDTMGDAQLMAASGIVWDDLVAETVGQGLWGFENLSMIPGTVGAAPVQNIGAYGVELAELIDWVEVLDRETLELHVLSLTECAFGYRDSIFKHPAGANYIVTRVAFRLSTAPRHRLTYRDLAARFEGIDTKDISVADVRDAVRAIRGAKLPDPLHVGTAGSFFKNPVVTAQQASRLREQFPNIPLHDCGDGTLKVPLAFILDALGYKGKRDGAVGCWETQPLCLVHYGDGSSTELVYFAHAIMQDIKARIGFAIEPEVVIVDPRTMRGAPSQQ